MPLFPIYGEDDIYLSRTNSDELLSAYADYAFELDGLQWPTVEHYFQAMKFDDEAYRAKIAAASSPKKARALGRSRLKRIRKDWKDVRTTVMTRALYIRAKTHEPILEALRETGEKQIVENNNYDYFWGCGRDRRGDNKYGKVLMAVREKLNQEVADAQSASAQG